MMTMMTMMTMHMLRCKDFDVDIAQVREDVQHIFGEEFRVWQWLPDLAW